MSGKLGYTWYPKDFISDPDVMFMTAAERGVYRDLIDLAYMSDNAIKYSVDLLAKYTHSDVETVQKILDIKGEKIGDIWTIPSCAKRIALAEKNRANGSKGGRPKGSNKKEAPKDSQPKQTEEPKLGSVPATDPLPVFEKAMELMLEVKDSIVSDETLMMEMGAVAKIPNPKDVKGKIEEFFLYQKTTDKYHTEKTEFKKHFFSWYSKKYPNLGMGKSDPNSPPGRDGIYEKEVSDQWIWLNNGWRDTTTFTKEQKRQLGMLPK